MISDVVDPNTGDFDGQTIMIDYHQDLEVALFVLVVGRAGEVEVTHDVARGFARLSVTAVRGQVAGQPFEQAEHAFDALVAGPQHLEGFVEAGRGGGVQCQR